MPTIDQPPPPGDVPGQTADDQRAAEARPSVFISYAHEDEEWKDRLVKHCAVLGRQGLLEIWDDRQIDTGQDWHDKIRDAIERAKLAVLLISADFLASEFILQHEVPRLLERRETEGLVIFPLLLKPCGWQEVDWLARMNLRPRDGRPVGSGDGIQIDVDFTEFASELGQVIRRLGPAPAREERSTAPIEPATESARRTAAPVQVRIGTVLGSYEIQDILGAGGATELFLAEDTRRKHKVALRVLDPEIAADPERLARFQRAAEAAAALDHPNIVPTFPVEKDRGLSFFTMEVAEGDRLERVIPEGGLALDTFFHIAVRLADALAAAHRQGIVHGHLAAADVLVAGRRVKVTGFGQAELPRGSSTDNPGASLPGAPGGIGGPPTGRPDRRSTERGQGRSLVSYMAPEQVAGGEADQRTDVFALGVLMFEMVTGRKPFEGDSAASLIASILRDDPSSVSELKLGLPRRLGKLIQHCLEKDPAARYPSAWEVLEGLESLREKLKAGELTVVDTGPGMLPALVLPADAPSKKRPWLPLSAGAVLVLLAAGLWALRGGGGSGDVVPPGDADPAAAGRAEVAETTALDSASTAVPAGPGDETRIAALEDAAPQEPAATIGREPPAPGPPPSRSPPPPNPAPPPRASTTVAPPPSARTGSPASDEPTARDPPARPVETEPAPPPPEPAPPPLEPAIEPAAAVERSPPPPVALPPPEPSPEIVAEQERQAIRQVLDRYAAAMSSLDLAAVLEVWPGGDDAKLSKSFASLKSQRVDIKRCEVELGDPAVTAEASCQERGEVVLKRGIAPDPREQTIVFSLQKRGDSWLIVERRAGR